MKSRKVFSTEFVTTNRARPWALYAGNTPRPAVPGNYKKRNNMNEERMMKWFAYEHLPEHLQIVSRPFWRLGE
jgi:hypothetical protein